MKILTKNVYRRTEREDQPGFRKNRGTRGVIPTRRIVPEGKLIWNKITRMDNLCEYEKYGTEVRVRLRDVPVQGAWEFT